MPHTMTAAQSGGASIAGAGEVKSRENSAHYLWGQGCDGWHFVDTPGLSVIQERMPPSTKEQMHFHTEARQFFFILSGEAVMELKEGREVLRKFQGIEIPPGMPHRMRNESGYPIDFIVVSAPHAHGDRVVSEPSR